MPHRAAARSIILCIYLAAQVAPFAIGMADSIDDVDAIFRCGRLT